MMDPPNLTRCEVFRDWDLLDWIAVLLQAAPWLALYVLALYGLVQPDVYWWRLTRKVRRDMKIRKLHGPN